MSCARRWFAAVAALSLLAACDPQTATAPTGDLELIATFDDVQDLTRGHDVQVADVAIGSVRAVELDGHRARVRMSIVDGRDIPVGTSAVVRRTSLLGEYYVDLVFPEGFDGAGPFLPSGTVLDDTSIEPDLEQLAEQAAIVIGSIAGDDVAGLIETGAEAIGGRGGTINAAVDDAAVVLDTLAAQQDALATAIDELAALGATLAPRADDIGVLIEQLAAATGEVAGSRDRVIETVEALVALASTTTEVLFVPHTQRFVQTLDELDPILAGLADQRDVLSQIVVDFRRFTQVLPSALYDGQLLLLAWAYLDTTSLGLGEQNLADPIYTILGDLLAGLG
jgi:phospholipid/cholesterol/gamma-HCH transport system substrate-binding protein